MSTAVWFLASAAAVVSALAVVTQRNPFVSALALLGNLASLATLYLLLQSDFVAAAQIMVYAGAIMVMFLFVIAYVGPRGELADESRSGWQLTAACVAAGAIFLEIGIVITRATFAAPASAPDSFGSPRMVGEVFLTRYVGAFEIVSILLLVAAVAAVVLGAGPRPSRVVQDDPRQEKVREARRLAAAAREQR